MLEQRPPAFRIHLGQPLPTLNDILQSLTALQISLPASEQSLDLLRAGYEGGY